MRRKLWVALLALGVCWVAVPPNTPIGPSAARADEKDDALAAKATAQQYKNGAMEWLGLYEQHKYDASQKFDEAWALYWYYIDEWIIFPDTDEDRRFRNIMNAGGDPEADREDPGYNLQLSPWHIMIDREIGGYTSNANGGNDFNQGNFSLLQQQYVAARNWYISASAAMPALKFQNASNEWALARDKADAAKAKWQEAIDYLNELVP